MTVDSAGIPLPWRSGGAEAKPDEEHRDAFKWLLLGTTAHIWLLGFDV